MTFPILSSLVFLPLIAVLIILFLPKDKVRLIRGLGIAIAAITLVLSLYVWIGVSQQGAEVMRYVESRVWIAEYNVNYTLGVDGISAPMIALSALLTTLVLFYSAFTVKERVKEYYILFLLLETGMFGVFTSLDLVLFYVFWELGLVPMFLLIAVWGGQRREFAALKFFLYTLSGSVFCLLGIIAVYFNTGTFNLIDAVAAQPFADNLVWANIVFWAFFVAFAIKIPVFPFHTWLPDAHTQAPTSGSVILAGVLLKMGAYGMMRIAFPLFPERFYHFSIETPIITVLAVASIVYGALVCLAQWDLKRLVAYSSVAHMGYVTLGIAMSSAAFVYPLSDPLVFDAAASGLVGAAMQEFAHGLITGAMFFLVGMIYDRAHTRDLKAFGGLATQLPQYYGVMLLIAFASLGLPGLVGFWSELFVFRSAIRFLPLSAFVAVLGMIFTAGYTLWKIVQSMFFGSLDHERWQHLQDLQWWEKVTVAPLAILIVVLGFYPAPLVDTFNAAITTLLNALPK